MSRRDKIDVILVGIVIAACVSIFAYISKNCDGAFDNIFWAKNQEEIDIKDPIVVNFSKKIILGEFEPRIEVVPRVDFDYAWDDSGKKITLVPKDKWKTNQIYFVKIYDLRNIFLEKDDISVSFETVSYPKILGFHPAKGSKNVVVDIEDPLKVTFDKPLDDFNVKFEVKPKREIGYYVGDDKKSIKFVFKDGYEKGQKYEVALYVKHKSEGGDDYQKIHETDFETEPPPVQDWSKNHSKRLDQAKRFTKPKIDAKKYIDINLDIQVMTIFENGVVLDSFLISSGKRGMDTPKGSFRVSNKHPRPWSKAYGLFMPYWMAIVSSGKFGIHELPEWPGGYKEGQDHLGIPVSHGCIRLGVGAAQRVYNWAEIGTPIVIY